jgi:hypothetical protein
MPSFELTADQAERLAAFLFYEPLDEPSRQRPPERLALLSRPVSFDEVQERVFKKVCWHCHSNPDYAEGDGGPGNTGGLGFAPRGLDLSSYEGVASGALDDQGERRSIFSADETGTPRLVTHLLARQVEEHGGQVPGITGMPLGLPAIAPEDIQLVASWITQGRPR